MSNGGTSTNEQAPSSTADQTTRNLIATCITVGGMAAVTILGAVVIWLASDKSDGARLVFGSLLPLLGTWVGTVLAFYFAKANFESAAKNTRDILGITDRLRSIPVDSVMLKMIDESVAKKSLGPTESPESLILADLVNIMRDKQRSRLPVIKSDGSPLFVIHLSTLTAFIASYVLIETPSEKKPTNLTIADLQTNDPKLYQQILAWVCVKSGSTLADAKLAMETTANCSDVFVTASGRPSDPVLGWITNVELALRSKA